MKLKTKLAGTAISQRDFENNVFSTTRGDPKAFYQWDTGLGIGRFLQGLKEGKIWGTQCKTCNRTVVPPRVFCELCFGSDIEWHELHHTGIINTFSICYVNWDAAIIKEPHTPGVIEIDGASPGCGILHMINEVDPKAIKIGMKVEAIWKDKKDRKGDITDIKYWKPIR